MIPFRFYLWAAAGLALAWIIFWHVTHYAGMRRAEVSAAYDQGRGDERKIWQEASDKERARQARINMEAFELSQKVAILLDEEHDKITRQIEGLASRPDDSRSCLGPERLRQLNAIR